jgi:hypothetical protein
MPWLAWKRSAGSGWRLVVLYLLSLISGCCVLASASIPAWLALDSWSDLAQLTGVGLALMFTLGYAIVALIDETTVAVAYRVTTKADDPTATPTRER